jgi:hypothetical protein
MRNIIAIALLALFASDTVVAAQTSKYGAPTWHVPYAGAIELPSSTTAALPLCDGFHVGALRVTTDAAATPVLGATATGGSTGKQLVMCNGANWINQ